MTEYTTTNFFDWEDFQEDPPYMAPEDAIVGAQGAGSPAGPCLTLTETPGWYRIASFANATVNDNHPDEQPTEDAEYIRFHLDSNYLYVCECDSEEEAREELGDPPSEGGESGPADDGDGTDDSEETPTPTDEPDDDGGTPEADGLGFGALAALVALLAGALLVYRRR